MGGFVLVPALTPHPVFCLVGGGGSLGLCPLFQCVRVCACVRVPCSPGQKLHLRGWSYHRLNVCSPLVAFGGSWGPLWSAHLLPSYWGIGTSSQKPLPSDCPIAVSPCSLPDPALACCLGVSLHWSPRHVPQEQSWGPPLPCVWLVVLWEKWRNSINFWCSGHQLWVFLSSSRCSGRA